MTINLPAAGCGGEAGAGTGASDLTRQKTGCYHQEINCTPLHSQYLPTLTCIFCYTVYFDNNFGEMIGGIKQCCPALHLQCSI